MGAERYDRKTRRTVFMACYTQKQIYASLVDNSGKDRRELKSWKISALAEKRRIWSGLSRKRVMW